MPTLPVLFDIGPAVHQGAGLARYAEQLAVHLLKEEARIDLTLFYNAHSGHTLPASLRGAASRSLPLRQIDWRLRALATYFGEQRLSRRISAGGVPALFHATEHLLPRLPCVRVLTVHDLIFEHVPQHHTRRNRLFLKMAMPLFVAAADAIIAVSRQTQTDLISRYRIPPAKIHVIYQGIDPAFSPPQPPVVAEVRNRYSPERPYLLMVGTLEPRKNHAAALRTLAELKAMGFPHRLVVAGGRGWLFEPVEKLVSHLNLAGDVTFAGYVPGADLPALYAGSDGVLVPSLYEGFGLPVLEAMACGAPVVCSDAGSLPEAAGGAALIAAADAAALTAAVHRLLVEPGLADTLRSAGRRRAADFRWGDCAGQTADLYLETVARRPDFS